MDRAARRYRDRYLATEWVQIEGALAYQLGHPILVLREDLVHPAGLLDPAAGGLHCQHILAAAKRHRRRGAARRATCSRSGLVWPNKRCRLGEVSSFPGRSQSRLPLDKLERGRSSHLVGTGGDRAISAEVVDQTLTTWNRRDALAAMWAECVRGRAARLRPERAKTGRTLINDHGAQAGWAPGRACSTTNDASVPMPPSSGSATDGTTR